MKSELKMKAYVHCGVLAMLVLTACGSKDANLFAHGSAQAGETPTGGGGNRNVSSAGASNGGDQPINNDAGGAASATTGGSVDNGSAGDPPTMNSAGNSDSAGNTGSAGNADGAGNTSVGGSAGTAGSAGSSAGTGGGSELAPAVCGNGILEAGEECDDAGHVGNGCDGNCKVVCSQHGPGMLESEDHHCYGGYNQFSFVGAQQDCAKRGAHLATISSAAENKLVRGLVNNSKWLGGDEDVPATTPGTGNYAWLTGESFTFTNWAPQEPNGAASHCPAANALCYEHCIVMLGDGTWADHRCDIVDGYVCEWEPAGSK